MLDKVSRIFFKDVPDVVEKKASIHTGAPVGTWVNKLFGVMANDDFDQKEAYSSTLVWRAIKVLSEPLASLPIGVFEKQKNGDILKIDDHPVEHLLNVEPNKYYSSYTWRETAMNHLGLTGNSYNRIVFRNNGEIDKIVMIDPNAVDEIFVLKDQLRYKIKGLDRMLAGDEILHVVGSGYNGFEGKNPIRCHIDTLVTERETRKYSKKFYQNGAFLSGILRGPTAMTDKAYTRLTKSWNKAYSGTDNAGKTAIVEEGFEFQPIALDPVSAGWLATRKNLAADVARIYGVPLHMLMELDKSTFNNIEHQSLEFVKYSLSPWVKRFEDEYNRKLFKPKELGKRFVRYDMTELLRGDMKATADYLATLQLHGNLSINEVRRRFLFLPGIDGGDEHLVQGNNMVPVTQIGQQLQLPLNTETND